MKMLDVLSVRENLSAPPPVLAPVLPERRTSPSLVKLVLPVWGYEYVRQFLECGLPTLLAPGNVPALAAELPCEFILLTSAEDEEFLREHATFKRLAAICPTEIRLIDHLITDGNYSTTITLAYTEVVRSAGLEMVDTCFFFLVSDYIMADGSLLSALKRVQGGASAVMVGNFQVSRDEAMPWLQEKLSVAKGALALPPREMMQWALNHLHPTTLANMVNIPFSHNSHTNRVFWRVDGATILGRFYLMHMLCVRPETTDFIIGASCDYSFVPEMCPSGKVEVLTDSDDYLVIEMQPRQHEAAFLRPGPLKPRALSRSLSEWTTATHRENARHSIIFHASDVPPEISASIAEADSYIGQVARGIKRKPLPHRGHPYWRGAMAAFQDATGGKLTRDEWRMALGLPVSSNWLLDWFMWRAQYALLGKPPNVLPWHPLWSDYRRILYELAPFLRDRKQRLLMVSNTPTVFTVSLSDAGERVHRLRGTPFLQSAPERFTPLFGRFDLCLLELTEGEMELGGELIDRIAPLMKAEGRIIVSVLNRRSVATARQFGEGVSHHGSRFIRSGALPTEIHFVPANRLRWMANRGMLSLRTAVSKTPWLGIPSMLMGGVLLMVLSLLGNLDALRRTKRTAPRGIASSLLMRLRVDARNARNVHPFSQFQVRRRQLLKRRLDAASRKPKDADASWDVTDTTRGPQYSRSVELKKSIGLAPLGMVANQIWHDDPRSLAFVLARYKFIAKMLNGRHDVAEVCCGDAFGARIVLQEVDKVTVYDPDRIFIEDIRARYDERWPLQSYIHDILESPLPQRHDALFSLDEIEYLTPKDEHAYIANLRGSLKGDGVLIIGTRSLESQAYAFQSSQAECRNCKSGQELKVLLEQYFSKVFLFSMNDEVVHTGFYPMAQYLFVMCTGAK
jgi:hypothetical protein